MSDEKRNRIMSQDVLAFPKPLKYEDADYLRWIRRQPCVVSHCAAEAHHVVPPGWAKMGSKVSDYRTVPLSRGLHLEYHRIGRQEFEKRHNVDLAQEQIRLLEIFISALREGENLG